MLLTLYSGYEARQLLAEAPTFWTPVCDIVNAEYFDRAWVQQEMSNARELALHCRETAIPLTSLHHFVKAWS
jgi:hypothetical protein